MIYCKNHQLIGLLGFSLKEARGPSGVMEIVQQWARVRDPTQGPGHLECACSAEHQLRFSTTVLSKKPKVSRPRAVAPVVREGTTLTSRWWRVSVTSGALCSHDHDAS